jgi:hypothetical protein
MNLKMRSDRREAKADDGNARWALLIADDVAGIDGDIERLVGFYRMKYGYTTDQANAALVQRLSCLDGLAALPLEDACCS